MKTYLVLFCLVISNSVWADWTLMSETKDGDKHYIDMTTLRKTGSSVKVWELNNFPNRKEYAKIQGVFSVRYRAEYDCINEKTRYLTISAHSELDAQGEMLGQDTREGNWIPIPPSTIGWNRLQSFCK